MDFALEMKVSEARRMFVSTRRYPLNFILHFPPFNDLMLSFNHSKAFVKSLLQRCDFSLMENLFIKTFFAGQAKYRTNKPN